MASRHPKRFVENWVEDLNEAFDKAEREYLRALDRGAPREEALRRLLADFLPGRYGVGHGHVVSPTPARSDQADIVIYDALECPIFFRDAGHQGNIYPAEGVHGILEVKSSLTVKEFRDATRKIAAYKRLSENVRGCPLSDRFGGIFAYRFPRSRATPDQQRRLVAECLAILAQIPPAQQPDLVVVLGRRGHDGGIEGGALLGRAEATAGLPGGGAPVAPLQLLRATSTLRSFLLVLLNRLRYIRTGQPDWLSYLFDETVEVEPAAEGDIAAERATGLAPMDAPDIAALIMDRTQPACPACGGTEWHLDPNLFALPAKRDVYFGRLGVPYLDLIGMICHRCGCTRLHSSSILGLTRSAIPHRTFR